MKHDSKKMNYSPDKTHPGRVVRATNDARFFATWEGVLESYAAAPRAEQVLVLPPRQEEVLRLRYLAGLSQLDVARGIGLSPTRVRQLLVSAVKTWRRHMWQTHAEYQDDIRCLSDHTYRALHALGLYTKEDVMTVFLGGGLRPSKANRIPAFGWKSYTEVSVWLGFGVPVKNE